VISDVWAAMLEAIGPLVLQYRWAFLISWTVLMLACLIALAGVRYQIYRYERGGGNGVNSRLGSGQGTQGRAR